MTDINARPSRIEQRRQAMQCLRTEHDVDERRADADRIALLTRNATADANQQPRLRDLQRFPAAELGKHLFLRFFANRTGIEQ